MSRVADELIVGTHMKSVMTHEEIAYSYWFKAWHKTARKNQQWPAGDWLFWLLMAGRGFGKTRTGAENIGLLGQAHAGCRIAVVAPTHADVRDTCFEGESGLLNVIPSVLIDTHNRSLNEIILKNGTMFKGYSADTPSRLRGPQHHYAWCDEIAAWEYPETLDMLMFGLRLGQTPRVILTTTPRPTKFVKDLVARKGSKLVLTTGSTFDNKANLNQAFLDELTEKYAGTRLGRQELDAEILDDIAGALWSYTLLDELRWKTETHGPLPDFLRVVVAIDPATTANITSDETGIVVAAKDRFGNGYVLADESGKYKPEEWARRAIKLAERYSADRIVAEKNNGGDMVESTIKAVDDKVPVTLVHASRGKITRAEPVSALYEKHKVHHVGNNLNALETQMCSYTGDPKQASPDRMDALVWALTELLLDEKAQDPVPIIAPIGVRGANPFGGIGIG